MKRRTFIAALGCAAAGWPRAGRAQQRVPRIGYLSPFSADDSKPLLAAFEAGLGDLGYVAGKTIEIELRFGDGQEDRMAVLAQELVNLDV